MNSPRITYVQRPDATPEAEAIVLANVYRFILHCHAKKMARPNRLLAMGPIWYEKSVREWEAKEEGRARGG